MKVAYIDLADFLAISELVLGHPADQIARVSHLELAESALHAPAASFGGIEFYPDLAIKPQCCAPGWSRTTHLPMAISGLGSSA